MQELIPKPNDRILCVKVGKVRRENLYEMTRKYWVVKLERASQATHVLAIVDGIVETVFIPQEWKYTDDKQHEGRCEFIGPKIRIHREKREEFLWTQCKPCEVYQHVSIIFH